MLGMRVFHFLLNQLDILTKVCQSREYHFDDIADMIDTTKANISGEYRRENEGFDDQVWLDFIAVGTESSPLVYNQDSFLKFVAGPEHHPVTVTSDDGLTQQLTAEDFAAAVACVKATGSLYGALSAPHSCALSLFCSQDPGFSLGLMRKQMQSSIAVLMQSLQRSKPLTPRM